MGARWSDVIQLIGLTEGTDDDGFPAIVPSEPRKVYANKKSVRSQEFLMAKQTGIELSYMFEVRSLEYEGEEIVLYENIEYEVYRTYETGEFVELICKRKSDDHA